jgi:hypothetical protein
MLCIYWLCLFRVEKLGCTQKQAEVWYLSLHSRVMWTQGVIWTEREKEKLGTKMFFCANA